MSTSSNSYFCIEKAPLEVQEENRHFPKHPGSTNHILVMCAVQELQRMQVYGTALKEVLRL